jgi:DNA-binding transcriptional LysR family regulator
VAGSVAEKTTLGRLFMNSAYSPTRSASTLLRLPFPSQDDVRVEVLLTEPRWVALPATHPLAACDQIAFCQLWDEPFVAAPEETGPWRDYHLATAERQGHPARIGAVTDQPDAYLTAIANGYGVALVPASAARYYARPGITYRPVTGVSPSQVAVAWPPAHDTNPRRPGLRPLLPGQQKTSTAENQHSRNQHSRAG